MSSKSVQLMNRAIEKINDKHLLLVFPITNKKDPNSLWFELFPRTTMSWDWSETSGDKVPLMWQLMKKLSDCRQVVYSKWYQGRATFFSNEFFTHLLAYQKQNIHEELTLTHSEKLILEILTQNSPLSTKELKAESGLKGKLFEAEYSRSLKRLFLYQYIVAYGEVEDGAFPSLAVGATSSIYEDLWNAADEIENQQSLVFLRQVLESSQALNNYFKKQLKI